MSIRCFRKTLLLVAPLFMFVVGLAAWPSDAAACVLSDVCSASTATDCLIKKKTVIPAGCTLALGNRNLVLKSGKAIVSGSVTFTGVNALTLEAGGSGGFQLSGSASLTIKAAGDVLIGGTGISQEAASSGGKIDIEGAAISVQAKIDLNAPAASGKNGGSVILHATAPAPGGDVTVCNPITANAAASAVHGAAGGGISLTSDRGSINLGVGTAGCNGALDANGDVGSVATATTQQEAIGGTILLSAPVGTIDARSAIHARGTRATTDDPADPTKASTGIKATATTITSTTEWSVDGGAVPGGVILLVGAKAVNLAPNSKLIANGKPTSAAALAPFRGAISASSDGTLSVAQNAAILAQGGGLIFLSAGNPTGAITAAALSVIDASSISGLNGDVFVGPTCTAALDGTIKTSGAGGSGGSITIQYRDSLKTNGTFTGVSTVAECHCGTFDKQTGTCGATPACTHPPTGSGAGVLTVLPKPIGPCIGCGNGLKDNVGEECDEGPSDNTGTCTNLCKLPTCGDHFIQPGLGEKCDEGSGSVCCPACKPAPGAKCSADTNDCTDDVCDGAGKCQHPNTAASAKKSCGAAPTACTYNLCDGSGGCAVKSKPDSTSCDDKVDCTSASKCKDGKCVGTAFNNSKCVDKISCTTDTCTASGCQHACKGFLMPNVDCHLVNDVMRCVPVPGAPQCNCFPSFAIEKKK